MANEITVIAAIQVTNGNLKYPRMGGSGFRVDQTTPFGGGPGAVIIGTAGEDISLADFVAAGWCRMVNLDDTNFVEIGPKVGGTFHSFQELGPGEECVFKISSAVPGTNTFHVKADTAECKVMITVFDR